MSRMNATRTKVFITSLVAALAIPAMASAQCGTVQGSFSVSCEQGVKVLRHNAPSAIPQGLSSAQAYIAAEKIRQQTELKRLAATERAQVQNNALRQRELDLEDYRLSVLERNTRRRTTGYRYGNGFVGAYSGGYTLARPIRIRTQD